MTCSLSLKVTVLPVLLLFFVLGLACDRDKVSSRKPDPQAGEAEFADMQTAAKNSLNTFRKLVTQQNYKELGFDTVDEVSSAVLGQPIPMFLVRLDQLREYQPGNDPNRLLNDGHQALYPITIRTQMRSSIIVGQTGAKWKAVSFGNAGLARQIVEVTKQNIATPGAPSSDTLVQVPAFGLYFLGRRSPDNKLTLIPLGSNPTFNLKAGASLPAEEVFAALLPHAKNYNGLPM
jgi:hypothetical protein